MHCGLESSGVTARKVDKSGSPRKRNSLRVSLPHGFRQWLLRPLRGRGANARKPPSKGTARPLPGKQTSPHTSLASCAGAPISEAPLGITATRLNNCREFSRVVIAAGRRGDGLDRPGRIRKPASAAKMPISHTGDDDRGTAGPAWFDNAMTGEGQEGGAEG